MDQVYSERVDLDKIKIINKSKKKKILLLILLPSIAVIIIATVITVSILLVKNNSKKNDNNEIETDKINEGNVINEENEINEIIHDIEIQPEKKKLEKEFEIVSNAGELKRISVVQNSIDETKLNNQIFKVNVKRKTNYDIYFISEEESDEENKLFYSKMYTCAISIVSECMTMDGTDCEPQKLVDLTSEVKSNSSNTRILNSVEDFKDIPIPLCLFNITDNNFITSITCHKSFPESKKNEMILDLYFFRPPAIQRADKEGDNITITITEDKDNNKKYIRELNGGLCNIYNNLGSHCTTDMNTTTDLEGHLLSYDELAITNITTDESNSFLKIKSTNLIDISEKISNLNPVKYKNNLDKIYPMFEPYMEDDIQFTTDNFTDLYNLVQEKSKSAKKNYIQKKGKKTYRSLMEYAASYVNSLPLFNYKDAGGIEINYYMIDDSGINTEAMRAYTDLHFDNENNYISTLEQITDLQKIIDEIFELTKAGDHLATEFYDKIIKNLEEITNDISSNINTLIKLLKYYDFSDVFDATLLLDSISKLPISIIEESKSLNNKLDVIYNGIRTGKMKLHAEKLGNNVYNYIKQSHSLIKKIFDNLKELGNTLNSKNNKITEVTSYYLNHTSSSYINTIEDASKILENYFKNEYDLIYPMVENLLKEFEDNSIETLQKENKIINSLYNKLINKNYTIDYASDEDYKNIILYLYNSDKYINEIINKIKEYFKEEIGIKDSGYFISNYDINLNKQTFSAVITEAKEVAKKLDKDEYIDKKFDEIMTNFRESYTNIMKYMEKQKVEQFPLNENTLETSLFNTDYKNAMETQMTTFRVQISNKIKEENEYYIEKIKTHLSNFLNDNLDDLNSFISDLDILFSEESLANLNNSFNKAYNSCLNKITEDIKKNEILAKNYFDTLYSMITDNNYLMSKVNSYKVNEIPPSSRGTWGSIKYYKRFADSITSKEKTSGYINKYNEFIANFDYSKEYLTNQLYLDIFNEYKKVITQVRELLQSIRNLKLTEKYPDFPEFEFYDDHIRTIDKLYKRLSKYLSDDLFNNNYINPINNHINNNNEYLNNIKANINSKHNIINKLSYYNDNSNDFCITYSRMICYGCTNCAWRTYVNDRICLPIPTYSNNYLDLNKSSINSDINLKQFNKDYNEFYFNINNTINNYTNKFKNLENQFEEIKKDTLNQKFTLNYLSSLKDSVNNTLNEKFNEKIIQASYLYYQKLINERLKNILENVTDKWENAYDNLINEIELNYDNFQTSVYEYSIIAQICESLISKNITKNYFDSIVLFQKTEFNYTISFYYNYYLKIIQEAYQYILSKIPKNENGFNDIIDKRRNEIISLFKKCIKDITDSMKEALSYKNQVDILKVPESNFFSVNSILADNVYITSQSLRNKLTTLNYYQGELGDDISLISRFYLENKENGKQIERFYEPVNEQIFVYLNLEEFKKIILKNWIFDQDDFINRLNLTLYETTKEIKDEISVKKENYSNQIEEEINKYFPDDSIENKISKLYLVEIKDLTTEQINIINTNIKEILNKVKDIITKEAQRIKKTSTSYNSNYKNIEDTISYYKTYIFREINTTLFNVLEGFYKNIYKNVYTNCMESKLNEYSAEGAKYASLPKYENYSLYNSSYNVGEIITNILNNIVNNYKDVTFKKINSKYNEYHRKISSSTNLSQIQNLINNEIDNAYNSELLIELQEFAIYNPGDHDYENYDLPDNYKEEINSTIKEKINNINNQIALTKGNNYRADFPCDKIDFSLAGLNLIEPICSDFKKTLSSEKEEQKNKINNLIQSIIKTNFDDLLKNIIPTFGTQFFERIIKYNENFKISSLYDNLAYSLTQTLLYYISLNIYKDVEALPKDLKIRLYNLNNLDLTVEKKNKEILKLLNKKINEFIKESKIEIMEKYMSYLQSDVSIKQSFDKMILDKINDNLIQMQPEMEQNYVNMLDYFLKDKLINSYSNVMNNKTKEMIKLVRENKEVLKSKLDDLFSLDSDQVLYEVNQKINNTLDSIYEYNNYFETFEITGDMYDFLNGYSNSTIKPVFEKFKNELNKATKDKLSENVNRNSKQIESLSANNFIAQSDNMSRYFNTSYFTNISSSIDSYGKDNYINNLDLERSKQKNRIRRRLDGTETEKDIIENSRDRIADKDVEEAFDRILSTSSNTKKYFDSLKAFNDFDKKMIFYKSNLNMAYKYSKEIISTNQYEEDIDKFLNEKLNNLSKITNNYYDKINESYYQLRDFLNKSLIEINENLNQCANITYKTLSKEYEKISNKTKQVKSNYTNNKDILNKIKYTKKTEHKTNKVSAILSNYREYGEFYFDLKFEGNKKIRKPKVIGTIINKSRPKNIIFEIESPYGNCGKIVTEIKLEFNDANYTMDLFTNSKNINITTISNIEKYKFSTEISQYGERYENETIIINGVEVDLIIRCKQVKEKELEYKFDTEVDEINESESNIIQG